MKQPGRSRFGNREFALILGLAVSTLAVPAAARSEVIEPVSGDPALMLNGIDLAAQGYRAEEFFVSGSANAYSLTAPARADGRWQVKASGSAPFKTRMVIIRPRDAAKFNGTVLVEWLNVTSGQDTPADWMLAHREIIRSGYAYVAVSAQKVGVEGGTSSSGLGGVPLKKSHPERYASLTHPGDAYAFDIFSQAGAALKAQGSAAMFGALRPRRFIALGKSQSAGYLTTYVNAIDSIAKVFDGFLVHSRFGSSAPLNGTGTANSEGSFPRHVQFRPELRVPVLALITETDLLGGRMPGYHASRRPDHRRLRVWEVAGTAHADNYLFGGNAIDNGFSSSAELATIYWPTSTSLVGSSSKPFNPGMVHHYVLQAAVARLDGWVRTGRAPTSTRPLTLSAGGTEGQSPQLALDANGLALGGVRSPWVDAPTIRLSGKGDPSSFIGMLAGSGEPFDKATLDHLYPGGKADYLGKFEGALANAIKAGHVLAADRQEILEIAAINFDFEPPPGSTAAPTASTGSYSTGSTQLGTLIDQQEAKAVLDRFLPGLSTNPQIGMARSQTLRSIQSFMPNVLTDDILAQIDAELAKIRAE